MSSRSPFPWPLRKIIRKDSLFSSNGRNIVVSRLLNVNPMGIYLKALAWYHLYFSSQKSGHRIQMIYGSCVRAPTNNEAVARVEISILLWALVFHLMPTLIFRSLYRALLNLFKRQLRREVLFGICKWHFVRISLHHLEALHRTSVSVCLKYTLVLQNIQSV